MKTSHFGRSALLCGFALFAGLLPGAGLAAPSSDSPSPAELRAQANLCRGLLKKSLIDFYLPASLDQENGGYKENLRDGRFTLTGERFLTHQARQLWLFSTLAAENYDRDATRAAADHGFAFLQGQMLDPIHGGYFSKVTDQGGERDPRKHAYLNSFALYGLAAYYRATGKREALQAAQNLFQTLEQKAHDPQHGGYHEFFYRDWSPVTNRTESGYVGAIGHKTYNTHLHLLEAFAELDRIWPDELVRRRLQELILINVSTVRHPNFPFNIDAWHPDWSMVNEPRNLRASYGHDVECVWLTLDAAQRLGLPEPLFRGWAETLCTASLEKGYDPVNGGFFASGPLDRAADDTRKVWWVQAEALVALLRMYQLTRETDYYTRFAQTLNFVEKHQIAAEGGWWAVRAADGSATGDQQRGAPWHAGYHAGRALILCAQWLEQEAGSPAPRP